MVYSRGRVLKSVGLFQRDSYQRRRVSATGPGKWAEDPAIGCCLLLMVVFVVVVVVAVVVIFRHQNATKSSHRHHHHYPSRDHRHNHALLSKASYTGGSGLRRPDLRR